uniref:Helicase ATP-binding domain-containing protein n=1 Tax=Caenorhabditis tropicalis TaxID=1561998 RepID=A0A1I7TTK4_9PELO
MENVKAWPKLLNAEVEAQFEKLNELIKTEDWEVIEERGLCLGNLKISQIYYDVSYGQVVLLTGDSISRTRWLKMGTPISLNKLNVDGKLKIVSEGHIVDVSEKMLRICIYAKENVDVPGSNYILTPSSNSGAIRYFQSILKDSSTLSSQSVHLVNLAYRSVPMPSIHDRKLTNLPETLNQSQQAAVSAAVNSKRNLLCIQGPPGTGKTRVIAEIVHSLIRKKKKVLVCAPTHVAVKNAKTAATRRMLEELPASTVTQQMCVLNNIKDEFEAHPFAGKLAELGQQLAKTDKSHASYKKLLSQFLTLRIKLLQDIFSSKLVVFTTLGTSSIQKLPEYNWDADVMLVDEAAQCTEPTTWVPVLTTPSCKKLVLVGDQKQLPAVVISDKAIRQNLNISLMEKLSEDFSNNNINILLREQYRMNAKIMSWSNKTFYENQLIANPNIADITLSDICPNLPSDHVLNNPILMIDMKEVKNRSQEKLESHSFTNTDELKVITDYVSRLVCNLGVDSSSIAVIAPYFAQIEQIRRYIPFRVDVNTVDAFQGAIGFLNETRRLNVAVTRAKRQFVLVGNSRMMMKNVHLKELYKHLESENVVFGVDLLNLFDRLDEARLPTSDRSSRVFQ